MAEYSNYSNVFLGKNTIELPKNTGINKHAIKLEDSKLPLFGPIYSFGRIELEMLKTYIKTDLANSFIWLFKSLTGASILFNWKLDRSLRFCMNYQDLNNITIKNQCSLPLIGDSFNRLGRAK